MKIFSYHSFNSSGVGGVEALIRRFHYLLSGDFYEIYNENYGGKHFYVEGNQIELRGGNSNFIKKIWQKISLFTYFSNLGYGNTFIFYSPAALVFIPKKTLKNNKIIIVQTNSIDKYFSTIAKVGLFISGKYIDAITVYTDVDKCKLINKYKEVEKYIHIIPRGCRIEKLESDFKVKNNKIVTIARIEEKQKNFDAMINIISKLKGEFQLDIYGDGDEKEIDDLKCKIKNIPYINYLGVAKDVKTILSEYSIFIITSYYEGFGQTLIEARSQGLPIVGFNTYESFSWIVKDYYNGRVIEPFDNDSFCKAIEDIYSNYEQYVINSLLKANETDINVVDKLWLKLLNDINGDSKC